MKRSETVGNGRKRSETVGNMIRPKLVQPAFLLKINISAQHSCFFEGPKGVSNRFPWDTFGPSKKKLCCAEMFIFKRNAGWTSFGLIMLPTVSDRFRPFHFFWRINWTKSIYGRLIQCKPVQTMTLNFFHVFSCDPCARTLHQILHLDLDIQYSLKITKSQELVKFNRTAHTRAMPPRRGDIIRPCCLLSLCSFLLKLISSL